MNSEKRVAIAMLSNLVRSLECGNVIINPAVFDEEYRAQYTVEMPRICKESINVLCGLDKAATWGEVWDCCGTVRKHTVRNLNKLLRRWLGRNRCKE